MSILEQLGESPAGTTLTAEEESYLDTLLAGSWGVMPANWKTAISAVQLGEMINGIVARFLSKYPSANTGRVIAYLMAKTNPNAGGGGGGGAPAISGAAGNVIEMYPDGLFVREASWQAKEW